jgi:hypothetical protein
VAGDELLFASDVKPGGECILPGCLRPFTRLVLNLSFLYCIFGEGGLQRGNYLCILCVMPDSDEEVPVERRRKKVSSEVCL